MHKTKEKIITTALELFFTKGYEATSLTTIIEETNLSKGALYHHFDSKEAIVDEALQYFFASLYQKAQDIAASDIPALQKLQAICDARHTLLKGEDTALLKLFFNLRYSDIRTKIILENRKNFGPLMEDIITQGVDEGSLAPTISIPNAVHFIFALNESIDFIDESDLQNEKRMQQYHQELQVQTAQILGCKVHC